MASAPLIQLQSWDSNKVIPLFQSCSPRLLQVEAALTRQTPCVLVVDSEQNPQAAALQVAVCWYVVGYPNREFLQAINDRLPRDSYSVLVFGHTITEDQRAILTQGMYFVRARSRYAERTSPTPIHVPLAESYIKVIRLITAFSMLIQISLLAWIFLGETLGWIQIAGLILVAGGSLVVQLRRSKSN